MWSRSYRGPGDVEAGVGRRLLAGTWNERWLLRGAGCGRTLREKFKTGPEVPADKWYCHPISCYLPFALHCCRYGIRTNATATCLPGRCKMKVERMALVTAGRRRLNSLFSNTISISLIFCLRLFVLCSPYWAGRPAGGWRKDCIPQAFRAWLGYHGRGFWLYSRVTGAVPGTSLILAKCSDRCSLRNASPCLFKPQRCSGGILQQYGTASVSAISNGGLVVAVMDGVGHGLGLYRRFCTLFTVALFVRVAAADALLFCLAATTHGQKRWRARVKLPS